ncbi:MAG: hypothetical protein U0183_01145 [Polyangiaceae bacterium]
MSKKGRAKRTSGAPSSRPSVRAVADVEAPKASAPESASKEKTASAPVANAAEAPKNEPPKNETEAPKNEAEAPKNEAEAPKNEAEAPKNEAPKGESESPKSESPKSEPPKSEPPKSEAPKSDGKASKRDSRAPKDASAKGEVEASKSDAGDVDDEAFFTQGVRKSSIPPAMEADPADDRLVRLHEDPDVLARRAQGMKWVKIALAGFGALLALGAVMKALEPPPSKPKDPVFVHAAGEPAPSSAPSAEPLPSASPSSVTTVSADASVGAGGDGGSDASLGSDAVAGGDASLAVAPGAELDGGAADAKALKKACQRALDGSKFKDAITQCEASTAADPTDGEAWLLLGASYDQLGRKADARAAYQSCVQKGKRGPTGECAALLRQ